MFLAIPEETHKKFKKACILNDEQMNSVAKRLFDEYIQKVNSGLLIESDNDTNGVE